MLKFLPVYISAGIPVALILLLLGYGFIRYDLLKLAMLKNNLRKMNNKVSLLIVSHAKSEALSPIFSRCGWQPLTSTYERFISDGERNNGNLLPDVSEYFCYDSLIKYDCRRPNVKTITKAVVILLAAVIFLPLAVAYLYQLNITTSFAIAAFSVGLVSFLLFIFTLADGAIETEATNQLHKLVRNLKSVLPFTETSSTALLIEEINHSAKIFDTSAQKIIDRIENYSESILPVVTTTFENAVSEHIAPSLLNIESLVSGFTEKISNEQQSSLSKLSESFSAILTDTLMKRFELMNKKFDTFTGSLNSFNISVIRNIESINAVVAKNRELSMVTAENIHKSASEVALQLEKWEGISTLVDRMQQIMDSFESANSSNMEKFNNAIAVMDKRQNDNNEAIYLSIDQLSEMSRDVKAQNEKQAELISQYVEASNTAQSNLISGMSDELNIVFENAAAKIAESIGKASAESKELTEKLSILSGKLASEYENYFTRIEGYSAKSMDQLDYNLNLTITRLTEEFEAMTTRTQESYSSALSEFEKHTKTLIESIEEQSLSIGIYAKELNLDVNDLSKNLKDSVGDFSDHIKSGVEQTFEVFDMGLAEITERFANTLESIRETVEALPKAIGKE